MSSQSPSRKPSLRARTRYWFDNIMGRGTAALLGLLVVLATIFVIINTAVIVWLKVGPDGTNDDRPVLEVLWQNIVRTLDSEDVAPNAPWAFRLIMLVVTIVGVLIAATLVGIIASAFDVKVASLRKGRSAVLETGHTVILGWNSKVPAVVQALVEANASKAKSSIVVLSSTAREEMDDAINARVRTPGNTRIVCRSGDLLDQDDLLRANPFEAKAIILLGDTVGEDADDHALKTALALSQHPERAGRPLHLVGHLHDGDNLYAAQLASGEEAVWILDAEKVGQIIAQASQQPGLSSVYTELLNFGGTELYISRQPSLYGKTFQEVQDSFATTIVVGYSRAGVPLLNPAMDEVYRGGDDLVVLAEDDSTIVLAPSPAPDPAGLSVDAHATPEPTNTLILGSNLSVNCLLREMNGYAVPGSAVTIVSEFPVMPLVDYPNLDVTVLEGIVGKRAALKAIDPTQFDHAIVLSYRDHMSAQDADTRTLVNLLHVREVIKKAGLRVNVVSEMLDERNRKLAEVTQIDDFVVSDHLISLMMVQVAENPAMAPVFAELFGSAGAEIYVRPVDWYIVTGAPVSFATVIEAANARGETAIGFLQADAAGRPLGVTLNPDLAASREYAPTDRIVVIATN
jgi:voltage-gated potassium channel Kch